MTTRSTSLRISTAAFGATLMLSLAACSGSAPAQDNAEVTESTTESAVEMEPEAPGFGGVEVTETLVTLGATGFIDGEYKELMCEVSASFPTGWGVDGVVGEANRSVTASDGGDQKVYLAWNAPPNTVDNSIDATAVNYFEYVQGAVWEGIDGATGSGVIASGTDRDVATKWRSLALIPACDGALFVMGATEDSEGNRQLIRDVVSTIRE